MPEFIDLITIISVTTGITFICYLLKVPHVFGYLLSGIIVGPFFLNMVGSVGSLSLLSQFGIATLLFIVGLHLNPKVVEEIGSRSVIVGIGQVVFTSFFGFVLAMLFGFGLIASLYVALALTLSSTIVILKLLTDKSATQLLYGKLAVALLIIQNVFISVVLLIISSLAQYDTATFGIHIVLIALKSVGLLLGLFIIKGWLLEPIVALASKSKELLFLFSISWGLGIAAIFYQLQLSIEIGALIAGVLLATSPNSDEIASRLKPLRDFFLIMFFVFLGSSIAPPTDFGEVVPILCFALFVIVGNPLIVIGIMNVLGYSHKNGFMTGVTMSQMSEFSLILASLGMQVGHIDQRVLSIITFTAIITIGVSTYMHDNAVLIYRYVRNFLQLLPNKQTPNLMSRNFSPATIMFGCNRAGIDILSTLKKLEHTVGIVEYDPIALDRIPLDSKIRIFFGDASYISFLEELPTARVKLVVSTILDFETNSIIMNFFRVQKPDCAVILFAETKLDAGMLYDAGASLVVVPSQAGAERVANLISKLRHTHTSFSSKRKAHLHTLHTH